ncbi:MAG TPA: hypothetical protein VHP36_06250 [Chitinispirillaceae bacterium]|nr:hypothetical protein [Chitinispirillaceae bacterium]
MDCRQTKGGSRRFYASQCLKVNENDPFLLISVIIAGLTSYCRDDEFMYNLRWLIGLKIGGEIDTIPEIEPQKTHPQAQGSPGSNLMN